MIRSAVGMSAFTRLDAAERWPGPDASGSAALRAWIQRGIAGLRVADASVIPVIPNAPLNATVLAIAEKAADLITTRH